MVQATLRCGIPGCVVLRPETPIDVCRWLRDWSNMFHHGSGFGWYEALQAERDGHVGVVGNNHADDDSITKTALRYDAERGYVDDGE
jgi:hypothetical protein